MEMERQQKTSHVFLRRAREESSRSCKTRKLVGFNVNHSFSDDVESLQHLKSVSSYCQTQSHPTDCRSKNTSTLWKTRSIQKFMWRKISQIYDRNQWSEPYFFPLVNQHRIQLRHRRSKWKISSRPENTQANNSHWKWIEGQLIVLHLFSR